MIQRKQSLYFLGVFIISFLLIWVNPTYYVSNGKTTDKHPVLGKVEVGYSTTQMSEGQNVTEMANTLLSSTLLVSALLAFVCIFFFKNRKWQMILALVNFLFMLSLPYIMYTYSFKMAYFVAGTGSVSLTPWAYLPISLFLFNFLAYRGVKSDDKLIRSVDRLR